MVDLLRLVWKFATLVRSIYMLQSKRVLTESSGQSAFRRNIILNQT